MSSKEKQQRMFDLIEQWKASGEVMKTFVSYQGIALSKFQYWHKKYREQKKASGGFIQMRPTGLIELTLRYPNGVEILVPSTTSPQVLRELIGLYAG